MPQFSFGSIIKPLKILDAGDGAFIALQVLDASTLFFDSDLHTLNADGQGLIAPNNREGFQLKTANGIFVTWWEGEMWGRSDTVQGLICYQILYRVRKKKCGCGDKGGGGCGGGSALPPDSD